MRFVRGSICSLCNRAHGTQQADAEDEVLVRAIQTTQVIDIVGIVGIVRVSRPCTSFFVLVSRSARVRTDTQVYVCTHRCGRGW